MLLSLLALLPLLWLVPLLLLLLFVLSLLVLTANNDCVTPVFDDDARVTIISDAAAHITTVSLMLTVLLLFLVLLLLLPLLVFLMLQMLWHSTSPASINS